MRIKNTCKHIAVYILAALFTLSTSVATPAMRVQAQGRTVVDVPLLGAGSADEIDLVKILDMALNKAGMSMAPTTIRAFLEYWWNSVQSDIQTLIKDADTSITTASALYDYMLTVASDPTKADGLEMVQLTLKYAKFCVGMEYKGLDDFKNLLTQQGTFREFLLSYVTDEAGNTAENISNNKLAKYSLKSGFITMVRQAADSYIKEYEGYYLVATHKPSELSVSFFSDKATYDGITGLLKSMGDNQVFFVGFYNYYYPQYRFYDLTNQGIIFSSKNSSGMMISVLDSNWAGNTVPFKDINCENCVFPDIDFTLSDFDSASPSIGSSPRTILFEKPFGSLLSEGWIYTKDGRSVKVWKNADGFKNDSVGQSDIYYSKDYDSFEESKDTGLTFTGSYYNGSYSHDTIQNTIDNSQTTVDNSVVNNIVNNYITNNYGDGSGSGGESAGSDDDNSGSGGWWDVGTGISAFIEGIASLLDFILKLLGDLVGLLGKFLTSVLDVLSSLTALGQGFGDFLGATFTFLPDECVSLIVSSIAAMCVVGVVKAIIK